MSLSMSKCISAVPLRIDMIDYDYDNCSVNKTSR